MSRNLPSLRKKYQYLIHALVLVLPAIFFYQSLHPTFPPLMESRQVGGYEITPMPYEEAPPYEHDGRYVKDFLLMFKQGDIASIRQAFLNIGKQPLPLQRFEQEELGILHGTRHGQEVHAITNQTIQADDKIWLTIQQWDGEILTVNWDVPANLLIE